ncbi:MAG: DNA-processing protein DprA [Oscillospiraceae bacterium]|nr:DNA-processing protein DprA [Oscillospiraceae bacterium]
MQAHWIWFAQLPELTLRQKRILLETFPNPEDLYDLTQTDTLTMLPPERRWALQNKDMTEASRILRLCAAKGIDILTILDDAYPEKLRQIEDAPIVLYYKGILPDFDNNPTIGIVGTRKASAYGKNSAALLSSQIAACNGIVISGGASGIDTSALQSAVDADSRTVAVLGCGVDIAYPPTNRKLFSKILQRGCIVSEYPPQTQPKPWHFPARNRIISGLCDGVVVVEAPERSGALSTANHTLEQGRDVFAVPANIDVVSCAGSNRLLRDGAQIALNGYDVVKTYENRYPDVVKNPEENQQYPAQADAPAQSTDKKGIDNSPLEHYHFLNDGASQLTPEECKLIGFLTREPKPVDIVIAQMDLPAPVVLEMLTNLSLKGIVLQHSGRRVSVK